MCLPSRALFRKHEATNEANSDYVLFVGAASLYGAGLRESHFATDGKVQRRGGRLSSCFTTWVNLLVEISFVGLANNIITQLGHKQDLHARAFAQN